MAEAEICTDENRAQMETIHENSAHELFRGELGELAIEAEEQSGVQAHAFQTR
jgi:hypothetical protein